MGSNINITIADNQLTVQLVSQSITAPVVQNAVSAQISEGTPIQASIVNNQIQVTITGGGITDLSSFDTDDLSEGSVNLYYTDGRVENVINTELQDGGSIDDAIDSLIATHAGVSDAHHSRYTDAEAITALEPHTSDNTIHFTEGSIDHGSIGGLAGDDHTQYHNDTRGDVRYIRRNTASVQKLTANDLKLSPTADSTTALQLFKADGTTPVFNVDTTNIRFGVGTVAPEVALHVAMGGGLARFLVEDTRDGGEFIRFSAGTTGSAMGVSDSGIFVMGTVPVGDKLAGFNMTAFKMLSTGEIGIGRVFTSAGTTPTATLQIEDTNAARVGLLIKGAAAQSAKYIQIVDSSDNEFFSIRPDTGAGGLTVFNQIGADMNYRIETANDATALYIDGGADYMTIGGTANLGKLAVDGNTDRVQFVVQGHSTQNANLHEWQASNGDVGLAITSAFALKTDVTAPSDLTLITGAQKTLVLDTVVWNDLNMSLVTAKVPASNFPTWAAFSANLNSYTFALDDYADIATNEALHNYKEGTDIVIHIHLVTSGLNDGTARKAKYNVYYSWGDSGEVMSAEDSVTAEADIAIDLADRTHILLTMGTVTGTNYKIGSLIKLRVERVAGTGTEPDDDPFVEQVGVHYQINTIGSRQELDK